MFKYLHIKTSGICIGNESLSVVGINTGFAVSVLIGI